MSPSNLTTKFISGCSAARACYPGRGRGKEKRDDGREVDAARAAGDDAARAAEYHAAELLRLLLQREGALREGLRDRVRDWVRDRAGDRARHLA